MSSNERLFVWNVQINEWEVTGHKRGWTASRWIWGWGQPQRCSGHRDAATYPGRPHGLRRYKGFLERTGRKSGKHAGKHIQHIPTKSFFLFRTHCKPSPSRLLGVTRIICTRHVQIYIYTSIYVYILYVDICWYICWYTSILSILSISIFRLLLTVRPSGAWENHRQAIQEVLDLASGFKFLSECRKSESKIYW